MKYVRFEGLGFVVFPDDDRLWHHTVGKLVATPVKSAGFVEFVDGVPRCYGRSGSLGIGSAEDDSVELREQMGSL